MLDTRIDDTRIDISLAICSYNGEHRLPLVIDRLRSQINAEHIRWELIIVDNNSTDGTAEWVHQLQAQESHLGTQSTLPPIHYLSEPQQGTAFARQRAVESAQGEWVAFLDDDNLPHGNWLAAVYAFAQQYPNAGAFHGKSIGDYEVTPPQNFDRISAFWAIGGGKRVRCYTSDPNAARKRLLPPGAGVVVKRQAWLDSVPPQLHQVGRLKGSLVGTEDIEVMLHLRNAGWEIWYTPEMCLDHRIGKHRLTREYAIKIMYDIGFGRWQTRRLGFPAWQRPFLLVGFWCNDLRKAIAHFLKYRDRLAVDSVAAAEMSFFRGCLLSPFYHQRL
jgi:glycosyltransferase involved in cell wall biosynthesis